MNFLNIDFPFSLFKTQKGTCAIYASASWHCGKTETFLITKIFVPLDFCKVKYFLGLDSSGLFGLFTKKTALVFNQEPFLYV